MINVNHYLRGKLEGDLKIWWLTLIIVTLSIFIIVIDKTFMNVAISTLIKDLNTNIETIHSIIVIYALVITCLIIPGAKMQNIIGRKKIFRAGAFIYGVGAFIATISINAPMLLLGWSILEGIGAALMVPAATSIIAGTYEGERRAFSLGIISAMAACAGSIGPIIGGFLTVFYSWRYAFAFEVILILIILLFSRKILDFPPTMKWSDFNVLGALISSLGLFFLVIGILLFKDTTNSSIVPCFIITSVILLLIFYFNQEKTMKSGKPPLFNFRLFKNRAFSIGTLTRSIVNFTTGGIFFVIPVFMQMVLGADALITGISLIPLSVVDFIISFTAGKVSTEVQPRYIIFLGFLVTITGSLYLIFILGPDKTILDMMPGIVLLGAGLGIVFPHSTNLIFSTVRKDQDPDAACVMSTGINLSSTLGITLLGVILILGGFGSLTMNNQSYSASQLNVHLDNIAMDLGLGNQTSEEIEALPTLLNYKKVNATKDAFIVVTIVLSIGLLSSLLIPLKKPSKMHE
ncbi:MAG: putative transporter [Methanobacterium sp. PtaB.Bin024]|nr:MAG: putative transporter [Methanobacterium sp. PtaB.Bin024]